MQPVHLRGGTHLRHLRRSGHCMWLRRDAWRSACSAWRCLRRAEYLRAILHELSAHPLARAVAGPGSPTRSASRALFYALRGRLRERDARRSSRAPRGGRVIFSVDERDGRPWCATSRTPQMAGYRAARWKASSALTTRPMVRRVPGGQSSAASRTAWAWACISHEGRAGPERWWARSAAPRAWTTTRACWATAATAELSDIPARAGLPRATATPAVKVRRAGGACSPSPSSRSMIGQDPRTATSPCPCQGRPRRRRAQAANVVEQPRGECVLLRARQRRRSTWSACACARPPRRTSPA